MNDAADQYGLPIYTAAFRVMNDIQDYNKLGGLKKQLDTLYAQVYTVKEVCSHQNQAMVALVKLKSHGITDEQILNLNSYFERTKDIINPESLAADLKQNRKYLKITNRK